MLEREVIEGMAKAMHDEDDPSHEWGVGDLCTQTWSDFLATDDYHSCQTIWLWHARQAYDWLRSQGVLA